MPNSISLRPVSPVNPLNDEQRKAAAALLRRVAPAADDLGQLFARHGYELALVGGPVRDVFLGRLPGDLDLTTDAPPAEILGMVKDWADVVWTVGIDFGTVGLRKDSTILEITTYRSEEYAPRSRKPRVQYGTSLEEDLRRRDFTVNAMAARLPGHELVDPFGGLIALQEKVLRTPATADESFSDDALRILRAARFSAKLGFTVADDVREAMTRQAARLVETVSTERITDELTKLMLTPDPARGIELLVDTGVARYVLPEVPQLRLEADEHYRHKDVYQHSLTVLRQAIGLESRYGLTGDLVLRLAALLHDIGKPKTRSRLPDGRVAFHHHEVVGAKMARKSAHRAPVSQGRGERRLPAGGAAPALSRLRRRRVDRLGRAPVRPGCRAPAVPAERAHQSRLHHEERGEGQPARTRVRRPGTADRAAVRAGGAGQAPARTRRQRDHEDPGHTGWPAGRQGLCVPAGAPHR